MNKKGKQNYSFRTLCFFLISIGIFGSCAVQQTNLRPPSQNEYEYQSMVLHPNYYFYHFSDDSTRIYFEIDTDEVLYSRTNPEAPFYTNLEFHYKIYATGEDLKNFVDSASFIFKEENQSQISNYIRGSFDIPLEPDKMYKFILDLEDLNRKSGTQNSVLLDKTDSDNSQNFLALDAENYPIYNYQKIGAGPISIINERSSCENYKFYEIIEEINFPPPSFSDRDPKLPQLTDQWKLNVEMFEEGKSYFITCDEKLSKGLTISVRDAFFPEIKTYYGMAKTLRYICAKSEYEYLQEGADTKRKLDEFWLDCGGSTDRSRQLIKNYYERIESANYYFSNIIPGWKTDRGMILIVYGKPNRVKTYSDAEVWIYGEEGNINSTSFTFYKKKSIYSNQHYELERNGDYKKSWQLAVTSWRNGRIYNN